MRHFSASLLLYAKSDKIELLKLRIYVMQRPVYYYFSFLSGEPMPEWFTVNLAINLIQRG
jgi:hypothetical protein